MIGAALGKRSMDEAYRRSTWRTNFLACDRPGYREGCFHGHHALGTRVARVAQIVNPLSRAVSVTVPLVCSFVVGCSGRLESVRPERRIDVFGGDSDVRIVDAATANSPDGGVCVPGDIRPLAVYYGTREPTLLDLSAGQVLAVVMYNSTPGSVCSGTVIADEWALSAKHCNPSGSATGSISLGSDPDSPDIEINVDRVIRHPGRDLLLLHLSESVSARAPTISPIPFYPEAVSSAFVGRVVELGGYGRQETGRIGERRFSAQPVASVGGNYITVDGEGTRGVCGGDSGGPILWANAAGQVFVLGALTGGDPSCVGRDNYTAVDATWVTGEVGETDPCMGVSATGRCTGAVAQWCEGGTTLRQETCGGETECRSGEQGYRCYARGEVDPCGDITAEGRCDGAVAQWCEAGVIRRADCGRCGLRCAAVTEVGGAYCTE